MAIAHECFDFWQLEAENDQFLGSPNLPLFSPEQPQGTPFRIQGPPQWEYVDPEPARLTKWEQIASKSDPKSNLASQIIVKKSSQRMTISFPSRGVLPLSYIYIYIYMN